VIAMFEDRWGGRVHASAAEGVVLLDDAIESLVAMASDASSRADKAVAADDGLILGHIARAYLALYETSQAGQARAKEILKRVAEIERDGSEREVLHLRAGRLWAHGDWEAATSALERALLHDRRDLLALKVAQDLYLFLGNRLQIRDVVARVLPAWPVEKSGWGWVQGLHAFGLEENAEYCQAEASARAALHHDPRDVWATHALAHVFEMQGSQRDGIAFLGNAVDDWSTSSFAVHNWWHQALYHLELGEFDQVLTLYDGPIRETRSLEWLDIVDAASLLWRLSLVGVDVATRADRLASDIEPLVDDPVYIFNDWHAIMVFGLAGRHEVNDFLVTSNRRRTVGTNAAVAQRAGLVLLEAFRSFAEGHLDRAIDLLIDVRLRANAVGGSNAQRDVVELTLITAAARAGEQTLARTLVGERVARKPLAREAAYRLLATNTA
jgi:tetratricopeptide (TPR) repeat protein